MEEYIEQKAEEFELRRARANWARKVEIAAGQRALVQSRLKAAGMQPIIPVAPPALEAPPAEGAEQS